MPERKFIRRNTQTRETPVELGSSAGTARGLPDDLLRQAKRRLEILSLIGAVLWVLGPVFGHLALQTMNPGDPRWAKFQVIDGIAAGAVAISLALFFYLRAKDRDPAFVMDLALAYMIVVAFAIGVLVHWGHPAAAPALPIPTITWTGPVILMFAAIVPAPPPRFLAAGLVAALMDPLGMLLANAAGVYQFGSMRDLVVMHYPNLLLLGVAVAISHVVTRLGQQVTKEREMGSYRLGRLLGRGGMGEVYLATHRMLARSAAIKLIRPEVLAAADGESIQLAITRFRREAEVAAHLRSPHTVELYDFGVTPDQTLYFVMELLDGMDLDSLVREYGPLPAARVIYILEQVCDSLEEAHAAGLVHRDIKPANIHVGRLGLRHDWVKVLDFGLVKSLTSAPGGDSMATAAGITPGTPAYMAPEIALHETVDGRADLYALGCVAYYLLTGELVFYAATQFQMVAKHLHEAPVPPSQRGKGPVDPALDQLVLACLAKSPADRPQSAAELNRRLAEIAIEPWDEHDAKRWWSIHRPRGGHGDPAGNGEN